jgi:chemotaxis protein MotA
MHRMTATRKSTLIGLLGGLMILAVTATVSHEHLATLFNLPGLLMVLGGTLAATLVSRPAGDVVRVLKSLRTLLHDHDVSIDDELNQLLNVAHWHRAGNITAAEQAVDQVGDPLLRTGAQLVIDREPLDDIVKVMQWRVAAVRSKEQGDAHILRTLATFAPAFGMLGTLFGLIQMLGNLGQAALPVIGQTMSFALITTLYGLVLANMVFKPLAIKMEQRIQHRVMVMNMIVEGIVLLYQRRHPMVIREALTTYVLQQQDAAPVAPSMLKAA